MKSTLKTFGVARDILGGKEITFEFSGQTVAELRAALYHRYPDLGSLKSLFIAVNREYAADHLTLTESDEVALIPPVAGG